MNVCIIKINKYVNIIYCQIFKRNALSIMYICVWKLCVYDHEFPCSHLFEISANMWAGNQSVMIKENVDGTDD